MTWTIFCAISHCISESFSVCFFCKYWYVSLGIYFSQFYIMNSQDFCSIASSLVAVMNFRKSKSKSDEKKFDFYCFPFYPFSPLNFLFGCLPHEVRRKYPKSKCILLFIPLHDLSVENSSSFEIH